MNSSKRQSAKRKSTCDDTSMSKPIVKKAKHKQPQYVHANNNSTAEKSKNTLTSTDIEASGTNENVVHKMKEKKNKPEILLKTVRYIKDNSDGKEIDLVDFHTEKHKNLLTSLQQSSVEKNESLDAVETDENSNTKIESKNHENISNLKSKSKIVLKQLSSFPEDDDCNGRNIIQTSAESINNKQLKNNSNIQKNVSVSLIKNEKGYTNFLLNDFRLRTVTVVLDRNSVTNYLKTKPVRSSSNKENDNAINNVVNKINDSKINEEVNNKKSQRQTTMLNFFAKKNTTEIGSTTFDSKAKTNKDIIEQSALHKKSISNQTMSSTSSSTPVEMKFTDRSVLHKKSISNQTMSSTSSSKNVSLTDIPPVEMKFTDGLPDTNSISIKIENTTEETNANDLVQQISAAATGAEKVFYVVDGSTFDFWVTSPSQSDRIPVLNIPDKLKPVKEPHFLFCNDCNYKTSKGKGLIRQHIQNKHAEEFNKNGLAECPKCGRTFSKLAHIRDHKLVCGLVPRLKCVFCPERFKHREPMSNHLKKFHLEKVKDINLKDLIDTISKDGTKFKADALKAAKEGKEIPKMSVLNVSKVECELDENGHGQCLTCGRKFKKAKYLKMHQPICALIPHLKCPFCPARTKYDENMKRHLLKYHPKDFKPSEIQGILYQITKKGKVFKTKARRLALEGKEIPIAKVEKPPSMTEKIKLYCIECKEAFNKKFESGKKAIKNCPNCNTPLHFQCVKCKKVFEQYRTAWIHVTRVCEPRDRNIKCNDCDFTAFIKSQLIGHIQRKHTEIDPNDFVKCPKCDKGFKNQIYMTNHEKVCGKSKDHHCEFCSYKTKYIYQLTKHLRTHIIHSRDISMVPSENINLISNKSWKINNSLRTEKSSSSIDTFKINSNMNTAIQLITPRSIIENESEYAVDTANIRDLATFQCPSCKAIDPSTTTKPIKCNKCKTEMRYCCKSCGRTYLNWYIFRAHLPKKCATAHQYQCEHCDRQFTIKDNVRRHIFAEHMTEIDSHGYVQCPQCLSKYKGRLNMLKHMKICGIEPFLKCKFCELETSYKNNLRQHMQRKHDLESKEIEDLVEEICKKANKKKQEANKNKRFFKTKAEAKTYIPSKLPKSTLKVVPMNKNGFQIISKAMNAEEKMNTNHMIKVKCSTCSKSHTLKNKKNGRMSRSCSNCQTNYSFQCTQCSKEYTSCRSLRCHIKKEHLLDVDHQRDLHQCSECGKRFTFFEDLKEHWRLCLSAKNLICDYCGFATKYKASLIKHIKRKHMGIKIRKDHKCIKCGFKFAEEEGLQKHTEKCTGGHKCDECGANFISKFELISHIKSKEMQQNVKS